MNTACENKKTFWRREQVRSFINERCIKRVPQTSKEMPSIVPGQFYHWQFYLREALLVPAHLGFIAEQFWQVYAPRFAAQPFQLAGAEQAAVPIITALLMTGAAIHGLPIGAFTVRKEYKSYGIGNIIEGRPTPLPVVFVDDLTSPQHKTFWHCMRVIGRAGLKLYPFAFVLVRKQRENESRMIATSIGTTTVESIFSLDDFTLTWEDYQMSKA